MDDVLCMWGEKIKSFVPHFPSGDDPEREELRESLMKPHESEPGFYRDIKPMSGAAEAFIKLCEYYEVYILSTPSWNNPSSFTDKRLWVEEYLGHHAEKRLILSHRKDLCIGDYLIDDRNLNGVKNFKGEHIYFGREKFSDWDAVLKYLIPVRE